MHAQPKLQFIKRQSLKADLECQMWPAQRSTVGVTISRALAIKEVSTQQVQHLSVQMQEACLL